MMNDNEYAKCVDHLVSTMNSNMTPKSSQQSYEEYVQKVNKEREQIDVNNIIESIMRLGYQIDSALSKIIDSLDNLTDDKFDPNEITCTVDDKQVDMKYCDGLDPQNDNEPDREYSD